MLSVLKKQELYFHRISEHCLNHFNQPLQRHKRSTVSMLVASHETMYTTIMRTAETGRTIRKAADAEKSQ